MTDRSIENAASVAEPIARVRQYKRHPDYRDSGVEWLGEIPMHWEVKRTKQLLIRNDGGVWGEDFDDEGVVVLRSTEQTVDGRWEIRNPARRKLTNSEYAEYRLKEGDLVVTKSSGSSLHIGKTSIVTKEVEALDCCYSNFMQRLRTKENIAPRFCWYVLNGEVGRKQFDYLSDTTTGLANLNGEIIGMVNVAYPPSSSEQHAIFTFLDRETEKIDALVAKEVRLIELLQEKRMALVIGAVTKGLDPDVPMKNSGNSWMGEIPTHWKAKRVQELAASLQTGPFGSQLHAGDYITDGIPVINPSNIVSGRLVPDVECTVDEVTAARLEHHKILLGDILFARRGEIGRCGLVTSQQQGWLCGTGCLRMRPCTGCTESSFLLKLLSTPRVGDWLGIESVGSTMQNLNTSIIGQIPVAIPGLVEQRHISNFLDREAIKIDTLVAKVREAIDRLKELRTALISAAVTGKIDVREAVS